MKYAILMMLTTAVCAFSGCMYTIHMVHTQGQASDVIDDNDTQDTKTDANLQIPAVG